MKMRFFVPRDAAARAVGADKVAAALCDEARRRGIEIQIVRTGSRGLFWLEPMVEVETPDGRIAFGPVRPGDVPGLLMGGASHPLYLGRPEDIPFLKRQTRLTFARCGIVDPLSLADWRTHGGGRGLERARSLGPAKTLEEVTKSGLRGRGGAGFPTGIKWKTVADASADRKYVVCNADEGDSGTFADRLLLEGDPFVLIEGMAIAGLAVGASKGFVYIRSEYPDAVRTFERAMLLAEADGLLGGRRPRCWRASRANADRSAPSRRCPHIRACSAGRRSSTTWSRWPPCRGSWPRAPRPIRPSGWDDRAAPCPSSWPATSGMAASSRRPSA